MLGYSHWQRTRAKNFLPPGYHRGEYGGGYIRPRPGDQGFNDDDASWAEDPDEVGFDQETSSNCYDEEASQYVVQPGQVGNLGSTLDQYIPPESSTHPNSTACGQIQAVDDSDESKERKIQLIKKLLDTPLSFTQEMLNGFTIPLLEALLARAQSDFTGEAPSSSHDDSGNDSEDDTMERHESSMCYLTGEAGEHDRETASLPLGYCAVDKLPLDCWTVVLQYVPSIKSLMALSNTSMWFRIFFNDATETWKQFWRQSFVRLEWRSCAVPRIARLNDSCPARGMLPTPSRRHFPWSWHASLRYEILKFTVNDYVRQSTPYNLTREPKELHYYLTMLQEVEAAAFFELQQVVHVPYAQQWIRIQLNKSLGMYNTALDELMEFDFQATPVVDSSSPLNTDVDLQKYLRVPRTEQQQKEYTTKLRLQSLDCCREKEWDAAEELNLVAAEIVAVEAELASEEDIPPSTVLQHRLEELYRKRYSLELSDSEWQDSYEATARSATLVERTRLEVDLEELGAVRYGVTVSPHPPVSPTTKMPHPTHSGLAVGGSSGGAAVSVRTNLVSFACGTNGAGSNRIPAALCGTWGIHFGRNFFLPYNKFEGFITRNVEDMIHVCEAVSQWTPLDISKPPPKCTILALDEFLGPSVDTALNCVPGTCGTVTPFSTVHPVVKKWFAGVMAQLANHLNLVHHSDFGRNHDCPPHQSDISRPSLLRFLKGGHGPEIAADLHPADPDELREVLLEVASRVDAALRDGLLVQESDAVLGAAGRNADVLRRNGIQFVLSPLLRVPYLTTIPSQETDFGQCVDPTFNPYCILSNAWETASVTIPLSIDCTIEGSGHGDALPFGLVLTVVPPHPSTLPICSSTKEEKQAMQERHQQLAKGMLHIAAHVARILCASTAPPPPFDLSERLLPEQSDDTRVRGYPQWRSLLPAATNCTIV